MSTVFETEAPPLRRDADGAVRIGDSRVLLELVIFAFQCGDTPEAILQQYPSTNLADIYAVIAYYLRHRSEVEAYLADRESRAAEVRAKIDQRQGDQGDLRSRLLARRKP